MEKLEKISYPIIILLIAVALVFVGFESGKLWSARNTVTSAVASVDPWIYCGIHDEFNVTQEEVGMEIENYAVELYIIMSARAVEQREQMEG